MVKNHKRQQSAARRIAAFDCHWLSEVLQELSEVHVAIELHLFTQPVARHFHAAVRHVEQRRYLFGAQTHFQICAKPLVVDVELWELLYKPFQIVFVHHVEVSREFLPIVVVTDVFLDEFLYLVELLGGVCPECGQRKSRVHQTEVPSAANGNAEYGACKRLVQRGLRARRISRFPPGGPGVRCTVSPACCRRRRTSPLAQ